MCRCCGKKPPLKGKDLCLVCFQRVMKERAARVLLHRQWRSTVLSHKPFQIDPDVPFKGPW